MGTRVPGYPHLKLTGTQVSLPGPGYIITTHDPALKQKGSLPIAQNCHKGIGKAKKKLI